MYWQNCLDCLKFDDYRFFNKKVNSVSRINLNIAIGDGQ